MSTSPELTAAHDAQLDGSRSALPTVLLVAALSFAVAALAFLGFGAGANAPSWKVAFLAVMSMPLVLGGGAAFGPLLRATPAVEPSPLKLALFSSALSPVLVALLWHGLAMGLGLAVHQAWAGTFAAVGVLAFLGAGRRLSAAPAGAAAGLVCLSALVIACATAAAVWSDAGLGVRLSSNASIAEAAFAQALQGGFPWDNPWVAGLPLELRPGLAALLVAVAGPAQLLPLFCFGVVIAWCAALIAIAGYLASAALFREAAGPRAGLRDATAALAVVLLAVGLDGGRASVHRWLSMAYTLAFLVAALHAVRRGARPWPGLCTILLGVLGCLHPWVAAGAMVALALAGLAARRPMLPPLAALALLPGYLLGRLFGGFSLEQAVPYAGPNSIPKGMAAKLGRFFGELGGLSSAPSWTLALAYVPLALGLLALIAHLVRGQAGTPEAADSGAARRGAGFVGLLILAWVGAVAILPGDAGGEGADLLAAALLALGLAVGRAAQLAALGRASYPVAAILLVGVGLPGYRALDAVSPPKVPFDEHPRHLELLEEVPLQEGLIDALEFVRQSPYASGARTILFREPGATGPVPRNEVVSMAPILMGLPLFGGRAHSPGTDQSRALGAPRRELRTTLGDTPRERRDVLNALFELEAKWEPRYVRVFDALRADGYTLLFLVTEADRRSTTDRGSGPRGVDDVLRRMGAEEVFQGAQVSVYVSEPTAE